jgi:uncharacterized membrane protein YgcG
MRGGGTPHLPDARISPSHERRHPGPSQEEPLVRHHRLATVLTAALVLVAADAEARPTARARHTIRLSPPADAAVSRATGVLRLERRRGATFTTATFRGLSPETGYALTWGTDGAVATRFTSDGTGRARLRRVRVPAGIDAKAASVTVLEDDGSEVLGCDPEANHADGSTHGDHHDIDASGSHGHMGSSDHGGAGHGSSGQHGGGGGMHGGGMMKR